MEIMVYFEQKSVHNSKSFEAVESSENKKMKVFVQKVSSNRNVRILLLFTKKQT